QRGREEGGTQSPHHRSGSQPRHGRELQGRKPQAPGLKLHHHAWRSHKPPQKRAIISVFQKLNLTIERPPQRGRLFFYSRFPIYRASEPIRASSAARQRFGTRSSTMDKQDISSGIWPRETNPRYLPRLQQGPQRR